MAFYILTLSNPLDFYCDSCLKQSFVKFRVELHNFTLCNGFHQQLRCFIKNDGFTALRSFDTDQLVRVDSILIFLYMGWRISELLGLKSSDVDLEQETIKGGTKTKNGKNRIVPIHPKILPFIRHRLQEGNEYLFSYNGKKMSATQYYSFWNALMSELQLEHTPHECRHTFRSRLDSSGANKVCIDLLMGHKSKEVGERVYTHKTIQELTDTINLLT